MASEGAVGSVVPWGFVAMTDTASSLPLVPETGAVPAETLLLLLGRFRVSVVQIAGDPDCGDAQDQGYVVALLLHEAAEAPASFVFMHC